MERELFTPDEVPERHNLSFFPTVNDIKNHIHEVQKSLRNGEMVYNSESIPATVCCPLCIFLILELNTGSLNFYHSVVFHPEFSVTFYFQQQYFQWNLWLSKIGLNVNKTF